MLYTKIETYVEREFGMKLSAYKDEQLQRRIGSFISRVGLTTEEQLISLLEKDNEQRQKFLDFLTINVSEFFRNKEIFLELKEILKKNLTSSQFKIWSAACSYGCEPYTLAIIMDEICPSRNYDILATDIDSSILDKARAGEYIEADVKNVDDSLKIKHFDHVGDKYIIHQDMKKRINFKKHDLIKDTYETNLDLIVCRNVLIYFKEDAKKDIYVKFARALRIGGFLFVGATESIYNYKDLGFDKQSTFIYKKARNI